MFHTGSGVKGVSFGHSEEWSEHSKKSSEAGCECSDTATADTAG